GLVELDEPQAPVFERAKECARAVVRPLGQPDRLPGLELSQDERGDRRGSGGEEKCLPALELAERALGCDTCRVGVALVVELTRLAVSVGPDGRAVERLHERNSTFRFDSVRGLCVLSSIPVEKADR